MAREIERKFLVANDGWRGGAIGSRRLRQAYLASGARASLRVRLEDERRGLVTIKGRAVGIARDEFEYEIPFADALALFALRESGIVEKVRHHVPFGGHLIEVDVFAGRHAGLVVAEIEIDGEDVVLPPLPDWLGPEVSGDPAYGNRALAGPRED